jgi:hypothetical protein
MKAYQQLFRYELYKLIRLLSARVGNKMDASKPASVAGINRNKLSNGKRFCSIN